MTISFMGTFDKFLSPSFDTSVCYEDIAIPSHSLFYFYSAFIFILWTDNAICSETDEIDIYSYNPLSFTEHVIYSYV